MKYEIDEEIVKKADSCRREHNCLTNGTCPICKVRDLARGEDGDEVLFIECPKESDCVFCQSFGETHICQCPVRLEIFKQYGE